MLLGGLAANPARAMAVGVIVGGTFQALCQLPYVLRFGARFGLVSPRRAFSNPGVRRVLSLIAPTILGMAAYEVNGLVSTSLATRAGTGAATALSFSLRLQELVLGVFVVSVGTVLLPELSGLAAEGDWKRYRERLTRALDAIALITVPVAVISILERIDIVSLLFRTQAFGDDSVAQTASAFFFHMLGLTFIGANRILGVDNDPEAIPSAINNAALNGVADKIIFEVGTHTDVLSRKDGLNQSPRVIANILSPILANMLSTGLADLVAPSGLLFLGGVLEHQAQALADLARSLGLSLRETLHQEDWVVLVLHKAD